MNTQRVKNYGIAVIIFIISFSVFLGAGLIEQARDQTEKENELLYDMQLLISKMNRLINQSIRNAGGIVAYIQVHPNLSQGEFSNYSKALMEDPVTRHVVYLKDTTITYAYPLEGNENAIGVDLSLIEGQKEAVEWVKKENKHFLVGPVDLVQGGSALINRMPIRIEDKYHGQLSLVMDYNSVLRLSGIDEFIKSYDLKIYQNEGRDDLLYESNVEDIKNPFVLQMEVPSNNWRLESNHKIQPNGDSPIFYLLLILGLLMSTVFSVGVYYILSTNNQLNDKVKKRTIALENSLETLKLTQNQLIMKEKQGALAELVAGLAHEINTPVGVCVTLNSYLLDVSKKLQASAKEGLLKKKDFDDLILKMIDSLELVDRNLKRSSDLIDNFKQLATDHWLSNNRVIDVKAYFSYIISTFAENLKEKNHKILLDASDQLKWLTSPEAMTMILSHLITNSILHGFEFKNEGIIRIKVYENDDFMMIDYSDNGIGLKSNIEKEIFNPFFTTKRSRGNTGLGLHIIYNLITQTLKGEINILEHKQGMEFKIQIPKV
jgi:signal transduction histidine kinase